MLMLTARQVALQSCKRAIPFTELVALSRKLGQCQCNDLAQLQVLRQFNCPVELPWTVSCANLLLP